MARSIKKKSNEGVNQIIENLLVEHGLITKTQANQKKALRLEKVKAKKVSKK